MPFFLKRGRQILSHVGVLVELTAEYDEKIGLEGTRGARFWSIAT